jgi:hypothetical protein
MKVSDFKYKVTFNGTVNGEEVGEPKEATVDYVGENLEELIAEVLEDNPLLYYKDRIFYWRSELYDEAYETAILYE